jgi:hypothetical protein
MNPSCTDIFNKDMLNHMTYMKLKYKNVRKLN